MEQDPIFFSIVLIFTGAALMATLALYMRQSLLVAYILLGVLLGPFGANAVQDPELFMKMAHVGIVFLLFVLGLDLQPQELIKKLGEATFVTAVSSLSFGAAGFVVAWLIEMSLRECLLVGAAVMFSSTVIGVKLLPTTALHHQRTGEIIISILLLQDLIAVFVLLLLQGYGAGDNLILDIGRLILTLPLLIAAVLLVARYVLVSLIKRFDTIHEYVFLLTLGWCLGIAQLAHWLGLSHEIGAFMAGVALAQSPISLFIVDNLKPLRDFFLVVFFFSVGASLDLQLVTQMLLPAAALAIVLLLIKPVVFRVLLIRRGESARLATEIGFRLGQISEFALLIAVLATQTGFVGERASYLLQVSMLMTFVVSSTWIGMRYPTPMATSDRLRRD
jgi:Kef-type K+ transport system membrane component KefB